MRLAHGVRPHHHQLASLAFALLTTQCTQAYEDGSCAEDSDCTAEQTCLVDIERNTSYCVDTCISQSDCPIHQTCEIARPETVEQASLSVQICVDRVRTCGEQELCNGLDDDCDGVTDGASCELIDKCLDDAPCGGWVCQAPENQPHAVCAPGLTDGKSDFARCTQDDECTNGVCETGYCSAFCRPTDGCPSIFVDNDDRETVCARSVGTASRPKHNKCQMTCGTDRNCPDSLGCVWRDVFQSAPAHHLVCAQLDAELTPLGGACSNNQPDEGDAECQYGLCYGQVCTRSCGGFGADCSNVGANFSCQQIDLFYGELVFGGFYCVEDEA